MKYQLSDKQRIAKLERWIRNLQGQIRANDKTWEALVEIFTELSLLQEGDMDIVHAVANHFLTLDLASQTGNFEGVPSILRIFKEKCKP